MTGNIKRLLSVVAVAVLLFAACQKAVEYKKFQTEDDVPRISLADAKKDFDAGTAVFVDSRAEAAFKSEHIAKSSNVPFDSHESMMDSIPKGKKIIIYCS